MTDGFTVDGYPSLLLAMLYRTLADTVLLIHLLFILFVLAGGLLALRWLKLVWAHLPAALWGAVIAFVGWICPLTPLEIFFGKRRARRCWC